MKKDLYLFSGLGADERVFQNLNFSEFSTNFVKWIVPQPMETIENYTSRLLDQIPKRRPILIGLSFGGIIAVEVAKQIETAEVSLSRQRKQNMKFHFIIA